MAEDFDQMDFGGRWDEDDWERFFDAQDRLTFDRRRVGSPPERPGTDPSLSFRRVLRSFGMDPDNPESPPRPFSLDRVLGPDGARGLPFWHPGADPERLPLFLSAAEFSRKIEALVQVRYAVFMAKPYKNLSHRKFQKGLGELEDNARAIPRLVAMGHRVGYDPFGVNGNIVRCRRGLSHAENCVSIFSRIPQRHMDRALYKSLFAESVRLRNDLMEWVHLLRTRFAARSGRAH